MEDRVLIDTSIWINYFKGGDEELLEKAEHNCKIFSLDEHFRIIKKFLKIELIV